VTNTHFEESISADAEESADAMTAVVQYEYGEPDQCVGIDTRPIPTPGPNQVVVRMTASPINPSDLMFLRGIYGIRRPLPTTPGFEATGTVVSAGPGLLPRFWVGRRVACVVQDEDGCWADYFRVPILRCLPVPRRISDDQAATMLINPFTAWAMVDLARRSRAKAILQTAAGSALGRMIRKLAERSGINVVDVVRREEQAEELRRDGAHYVIVSSDHNFHDTLADSCRTLGARLAFDAVGGETTTLLASTMPAGSRILVYGALALEDPVVPIDSLIFRKIRVEGFFLGGWFERNMLRAFLRAWPDVIRHLGDDLHTPIRARYPLSQAVEAIMDYEAQMSGGKILLVPDAGLSEP
jgi:NADPH:quinone reductase-like Zn-dependent oxidoreductase